ncbi:hypothetical protein PUN4_410040 [Paraburkholderia unamae]|nr:hypothetical protein PUN4_410040 [Paraburkholderia unamae]
MRVQRDSLAGVVVTRDHVIDAFRRVVRIDHGDHGDAQLVRFRHGNLVVADVDHEDRVRNAAHVLHAADRLLQLGDFAFEQERFLLAHLLELARFHGCFHVLQALDRNLQRLEVGQHTAEPACVHERHASAVCLFGDRVARLTLRADEQDRATVRCQLTHVLQCVVVHRQRLFEVDDVNLVAMAENEGGHLRVPEARLVTEVDTGFQHLAHGNCHVSILRKGLGLKPAAVSVRPPAFWRSTRPTPWVRRLASVLPEEDASECSSRARQGLKPFGPFQLWQSAPRQRRIQPRPANPEREFERYEKRLSRRV